MLVMNDMKFCFNPKKSAQAGAYLLKLNGGEMDKYKWIKMLYWADRESLAKWCEPITGDRPVSMEHGQVLEQIYDLTKRCPVSMMEEWGKFISIADGDDRLSLLADASDDELSKAEIKILKTAHDKFKDLTFSKIKAFFANLSEHENVGKTSKVLSIERILKAVGKNDSQILEARKQQRSYEMADLILGMD
jgi:hypothetical protein